MARSAAARWRTVSWIDGGLGAMVFAPREPVGCGTPTRQGLVGGDSLWRRGNGRAAVFQGGGGAPVSMVKAVCSYSLGRMMGR
jgi:hypothetical protein